MLYSKSKSDFSPVYSLKQSTAANFSPIFQESPPVSSGRIIESASAVITVFVSFSPFGFVRSTSSMV